MDLSDLRRDYGEVPLDAADLAADPLEQFATWFTAATEAEVPDPNAMTLATVGPDGRPSARIVLLKGVSEGGFVFFSDYRSAKGRELETQADAALVFWWHPLSRQVRVTGTVARTSAAESEDYYVSRPEGSRLGAWASIQSSEITDRAVLETAVAAAAARFAGGPIPRPPHWGGYRLIPDTVEFWQGRTNRLHDRFLYTRNGEDSWHRVRLSP
jgi:pyridoxamine 5'-phosphate oxidase